MGYFNLCYVHILVYINGMDAVHGRNDVKFVVIVLYRLKALNVEPGHISDMGEIPSTKFATFLRCFKVRYSESRLTM
jgi:hypothetical protein